MSGKPDDRVLRVSRVLRAPPERVWEAWTNPKLLPTWFGPAGFVCQTRHIDLRVGGSWVFDMVGPDGTVFPNRHRFVAWDRPRRIDYLLDRGDGLDEAPMEVVVTLEPLDEGTRLTIQTTFPTVASRITAEGFGAVELGGQTLAKLARVVEGGSE